MAITFPANPSLNQEYTFDNVTYIWDGQKWTVNNTATLSEIYVNKSGDTMTGPLVLSADPTNSLGAATKQYADANGGGGGGGGGGSTTPVPQKVAYLRDEKPNGTNGGSAVVGWQDRTLNTKEDDYNLVVLGNDKEFTLSAGEYQIEWSAPIFNTRNHQTKLTNVTDGTTQEMGSSEFSKNTSDVSNRSFGSTRVKITTDTTYKIEHFCNVAPLTNGLGVAVTTGDPEVYTQVTITDLAIVGGTGTAAKTNIYGTAKAYSRIVPSEITGTTAAPSMAGVYESKGIVGVGKIAAGQYFVDFETGLFKDDNYIFNGTATYSPTGLGYIIYEDQRLGIRTATRVYIGAIANGAYAEATAFDITVHDNTPAEVALTTFGDIINYSGASAWGDVDKVGTLEGGLNIASVTKTGTGTYDVVFTTPMPDDKYSLTGSTDYDGTASTAVYVSFYNKTSTGFSLASITGTTAAKLDRGFSFTAQATNALPPKGGTGTDAWGSCQSDGTLDASFNVASVTRTGKGSYDVVFTTPMPTSSYAVTTAPVNASAVIRIVAHTTTGFTITTRVAADNTGTDSAFNFAVNATNATLPLTVTTDQIESAINNPGASAWGKINEDGTLVDGMNIASVVNTGRTAERIVTFQTPMPNANYSVVAVAEREFSNATVNTFCTTSDTTATGFTVRTKGGSTFIETAICFTVHATNALPPKGGTGTDAWASCAVGGAIEGSFNIASVTKVSTGLYDVLFTTPMPTNKYAVSGTVGYPTTTNGGLALKGDKTVNGFSVQLVGAGQVLFDYPFDFSVNATNATLPQSFTEAQAQQFLAFVNSGGLPSSALLTDQKPSGTDGGSTVAGWQTRTLNTKVDADGIVTLNNDEFTLAAGTYDIEWSSPNWYGFRNQSKLTDVTNGTTQEMGSSLYEPGYSQTSSFGSTRVKITSNTTYKVEHYIPPSGPRVTTGLGWAASNGEPEVYTQVKITGTPS